MVRKAFKAMIFGFFVQLVLGFCFGVVIVVVDLSLTVWAAYGLYIISYVLTGMIAARRSTQPYQTASLAALLLSVWGLFLSIVFGVFYLPSVSVGLLLSVGLSLLGVWFYQLWVQRQDQQNFGLTR